MRVGNDENPSFQDIAWTEAGIEAQAAKLRNYTDGVNHHRGTPCRSSR